MTHEEMKALQPGDIVSNQDWGDRFIVTANYGDRVTAVRTADLTNPDEWNLVSTVKRTVIKS